MMATASSDFSIPNGINLAMILSGLMHSVQDYYIYIIVVFLFGFIKRLLNPIGLHHIFHCSGSSLVHGKMQLVKLFTVTNVFLSKKSAKAHISQLVN
ncbi:hypothetical protein ACVNP1_01220 [Staphylococcus aureus]